MPYGEKEELNPAPVSVVMTDQWGGEQTLTIPVNTIRYKFLRRLGTNYQTKPLKKAPRIKAGVRHKLVYERVILNRSLPSRKFSKRLGKMIYDRKNTMKIARVVSKPYYRRGSRSFKGFDIPPNPLTYVYITTQDWASGTVTNGVWTLTGPHWLPHKVGSQTYGQGVQTNERMSIASVTQTLIDELDSQAYPSFLAKVKNQKVNLAQAIGERKQTAGLLVESASRIALAIKQAKSLNFAGAMKTLVPKSKSDIANDWLLWQYGIKPLVSDIEGAAQLLATDIEDQYDVVVYKKGEVPFQELIAGGNSGSATDYLYCNWNTTISSKVTVKYKARIKVTAKGLKFLSEVGLSNLVELGWQLAPWTFVIDWFLPVGDYLAALDATLGAEVIYAHKTIFSEENIVQVKDYNGYLPFYGTSSGSAVRRIRRVQCTREILPSLPELNFPRLAKDPLNATRIANAIALLIQLRKK